MVTRRGGSGCAETQKQGRDWSGERHTLADVIALYYCADMELDVPTLLVSVAWTVPISVATSLTVKTCV